MRIDAARNAAESLSPGFSRPESVMPASYNDPIKVAASIYAHRFAAELLAMGIRPPAKEIVGSAIIEIGGIRVVVSVTAYEGPARLVLSETGKRVLGMDGEGTKKVRDIEKAILDATPTDHPISLKKLATATGYKLNWYFRDAVRHLIDAGTIFRVTGGVRRK